MQLIHTLATSSNTGTFIGSAIYFVVWVVVMVWVYNIAKRKGRHAVGWVIFAFFFSLLALILILLLPSKRTTEYVERH